LQAQAGNTMRQLIQTRQQRGAGIARAIILLREALSRFFTEYYRIPVGIIFIAMVIFMPQGLLGFMRRWPNR
jgi:ABC-type branched-subunit amino acid transport system permease subunit